MLRDSYDLVVIGGGPVGVTAALRGASLGYNSILIDATPPRQYQFTGPTGLFSKALRDSALRLDVPVLRSMGISDIAIWAQINEFVQQILRKSGENNMNALSLNRVPHLRGLGSLRKCASGRARYEQEMGEGSFPAAQCEVEVSFTGGRADKVVLKSQNVLVATGSKAVRLQSIDGWYDTPVGDHIRCYDSDSIKRLSFLPRSVVVIGGGIIAVEFARIFAALAADVTMVVRASDLPKSLQRVGIDRQIGFLLQSELVASGVRLLFESEITSAEAVTADGTVTDTAARGRQAPKELRLTCVKTGTLEERPPLMADLVLSATGRKAVTDGLGLEEVGVELQRNGDVCVNSNLMTTAEGIYAAGDLIGAPQLASTGIEQAEAAIDAMLDRRSQPNEVLGAGAVFRDCSPEALLSNAARYPIGIWTMPEVAFVGLTAEAAAAPPHNLDVVEGVGRYSESIRGHVHTVGTAHEGEYLGRFNDASDAEDEELLTGPVLKLVVERAKPNRIVGVHIFGDNACELIHFGTTLVQGGKTISDILAVCYAAVTYHELFKLAARDAITTLTKDAWRDLYKRLDDAGDGNGKLDSDEVYAGLEAMGGEDEFKEDILKALFVGRGDSKEVVSVEQFVKRAMKMQSPMQVGLLGARDGE